MDPQLAAARQHDALVLASAGPRFHQKSGVWSDTQAALQDRGNDSGLVTELDPDATTRCLTISCRPCVAGLIFPGAGCSRDCFSRALAQEQQLQEDYRFLQLPATVKS